jgi:hypothetical protein
MGEPCVHCLSERMSVVWEPMLDTADEIAIISMTTSKHIWQEAIGEQYPHWAMMTRVNDCVPGVVRPVY